MCPRYSIGIPSRRRAADRCGLFVLMSCRFDCSVWSDQRERGGPKGNVPEDAHGFDVPHRFASLYATHDPFGAGSGGVVHPADHFASGFGRPTAWRTVRASLGAVALPGTDRPTAAVTPRRARLAA